MTRTRMIIASIALAGAAVLGLAKAGGTSGVASHDLKKDIVSSTISNVSGVQTFSVTCPDGGVALLKSVSAPLFEDPLYYHMSERLSESGHVVTAHLGEDWTDESTFTATLTAVCVSLAD